MKLHKDEVEINEQIVRNLIKEQYSSYGKDSLNPLGSMGTDNVMFTLGEDKLVRLPRVEGAVSSLEKEARWLPTLGQKLKISIPKVFFEGDSSSSYPFPWLVISKLAGKNIASDNILDEDKACQSLAEFILDLRSVSVKGAPSCSRGLPLLRRDSAVRKSILLLQDDYDTKLLTELWEDSLKASDWQDQPLWLHGDLHRGNVLVKDGELSAVLDFGLSGVGDPSCDLMAAWTLLGTKSRKEFFSLLGADSDSIRKARGWALSMGILGYPYYKDTNPSFALLAKNSMDEVIKDPFYGSGAKIGSGAKTKKI